MDQNKLFALEERLRAVEGNDWFDLMRATKVCLVPNIVVPKDFRIPDFIKYTGLECPKHSPSILLQQNGGSNP